MQSGPGNLSSASSLDLEFLSGLVGPGSQDLESSVPDDIPLLILAVFNCSICFIVILSELSVLLSYVFVIVTLSELSVLLSYVFVIVILSELSVLLSYVFVIVILSELLCWIQSNRRIRIFFYDMQLLYMIVL